MDPAQRIEAYFDSCTNGTAEEIAAHFTADATIYDTNHRPVRTADEIGRFWERIRGQWEAAVWTMDTVVSDGDAAAIEWTMTGVDRAADGDVDEKHRFAVRGSEHYRMVDDRIDEIRQYWTFDADRPGSELVGFPYDADDRFLSFGSSGQDQPS